MCSNPEGTPMKNRITFLTFAWTALLAATVGCTPGAAQTYVSAEPIPSEQIVGPVNLASIESLDYATRALWGQRLLSDCHMVQNVIDVLVDGGAISTVNHANTSYRVAAGGFQGVTDPSYVFTIVDSGPFAASQSDIFVLDNALGYALNQGGTAQFGLAYDPSNPNTFANQYAVVTFPAGLTGEQAEGFFNYLGTIDPALWTGANAGFTQINLHYTGPDNSMLFLIGNVSTEEFENGLFEAASTTEGATYSPLLKNGQPTVATAGAAFPGNDWVAFPSGEGYLEFLVNPSPQLLRALAALRQRHLHAAAALLQAIKNGTVTAYLGNQFTCPR